MKVICISRVRTRRLLHSCGVILVLLCVLCCFALRWRSAPVFAPAGLGQRTLVIDAGHGGEDGGAVSPSGISESTINLAIALRLDAFAGLVGVPTVMTRTDDSSLKSADAETLREMKRSDLKNRVKLIQSTPNPVLISIHQNNFADARSSGAQVFYGHAPTSAALGSQAQAILRAILAPENDRAAKEISGDIYLMRNIDCPALLVECGFLSNSEEEALLQTPQYQLRIAAALLYAYLTN